jgi:hypothetical protein
MNDDLILRVGMRIRFWVAGGSFLGVIEDIQVSRVSAKLLIRSPQLREPFLIEPVHVLVVFNSLEALDE